MKKTYTISGIIIITVLVSIFYSCKNYIPLYLPHVTITGKAINVKHGAEVETNKYGTVLIQDLSTWPNEVVGKKVKIIGKGIKKIDTVPKATTDENGLVSQGATEKINQYVLEGLITWKLQ